MIYRTLLISQDFHANSSLTFSQQGAAGIAGADGSSGDPGQQVKI